MRKSRVIFDFGSTYFTIFSNGRLLLRKPAAIVLKKSLQPQITATGEDALARRDAINDDELFLRPVKAGAVAHREGCILLIKSCMQEAMGRFVFPSVCVLIGCGLGSEQRLEIEKAFVDAGFADIMIMESLLGLMPEAERKGIKAGLIIGGETTEFGLLEEGKLINGYTLDIGSATVNERIREYIGENYKLNISEQCAEELKLHVASLYANDNTYMSISGKDALTGKVKKLTVTAKELYNEAVYVFGRIVKVINAALTAAPIMLAEAAAKNGLIVSGAGSLFEGFSAFVIEELGASVFMGQRDSFEHLSGAEELACDDRFVENYLGLKREPKKKPFGRN